MAEMPDVVTGNTIASQWGNDVRDRTVQRYASAAQRTTEHPTPTQGDLSFLEDTGDIDVYASGGWQHIGAPTGAIAMWGAAAPPAGWLICQGQAISRTTYAALFAELGTTYGAGDGSTTFNLPDVQQRFPLGKGASQTLGQTGGSINHTHSGPSHSHVNPNTDSRAGLNTDSQGSHNHGGDTGQPGSFLNGIDNGTAFDSRAATLHTHSISSSGSHSHTTDAHSHTQNNTGAAGTGATGTNNPPFLVVHFIVKI